MKPILSLLRRSPSIESLQRIGATDQGARRLLCAAFEEQIHTTIDSRDPLASGTSEVGFRGAVAIIKQSQAERVDAADGRAGVITPPTLMTEPAMTLRTCRAESTSSANKRMPETCVVMCRSSPSIRTPSRKLATHRPTAVSQMRVARRLSR